MMREDEEAARRERSDAFDRAMRMAESANEVIRKAGEELLLQLAPKKSDI
jgi:hypothetical protein